ncbi:MAG: 50S ribosomal protein L4 [Fimbriimonas sp.]
MSEITLFKKDGKAGGTHKLGAALSSVLASHTTVHRAVVAEEANSRQGTQKTKGRVDVRGGGAKPYKQKKTGNARQGSRRSPHYAHGAMALSLTPRDYEKKVNKKERRAAILTAFAAQAHAGHVSVVESIQFTEPKTKEAVALLTAVGVNAAKRVLVILPAYDEVTLKCFRNLPNVVVRTAPSNEAEAKTQAFSARDILIAHKIVVAQEALAKMEQVWSSAKELAK